MCGQRALISSESLSQMRFWARKMIYIDSRDASVRCRQAVGSFGFGAQHKTSGFRQIKAGPLGATDTLLVSHLLLSDTEFTSGATSAGIVSLILTLFVTGVLMYQHSMWIHLERVSIFCNRFYFMWPWKFNSIILESVRYTHCARQLHSPTPIDL